MFKRMHTLHGKQFFSSAVVFDDRFRFSVVFIFAIAVGTLSWAALPNGGLDMRNDILPALKNWRMPWAEGTPLFPWAVLVLMPLRLFSPANATIAVSFASVILTAAAIRRMGGDILLTIPVFVSPVGYWMIHTGQTDALMLGAFLLLPHGYDLLFFWKPQVLLHALWARVMQRPRIYFIVGPLLFGLSVLIWGNWIQAIVYFAHSKLLEGWWNRSLWPYSIPVGLVFLYLSIMKKDESYGIAASPLLSPYVNGASYIGLLAVVAAKWPIVFIIGYFIFWVYEALAIAFPDLLLRII